MGKPKRSIGTPLIPADERGLEFSFRHLQIDYPRFTLSNCCTEFFIALFREIQRYKSYTADQFKEISQDDHRHPIIWEDTQMPAGYPDIDPSDDETWTEDAWQFALAGKRGEDSQMWRVYGFITNGVFYIVWLDPKHDL